MRCQFLYSKFQICKSQYSNTIINQQNKQLYIFIQHYYKQTKPNYNQAKTQLQQTRMFNQITNISSQLIKIYIRLKDKKSFLTFIKSPILIADLKDLVVSKTKIPEEDLIIFYKGIQVHFKEQSLQQNQIQLQDRAIIHAINKKNIRNDKIEVIVKLILKNDTKTCLGQTKLTANASQSIQNFIEHNLAQIITQTAKFSVKASDITLVLNGRALENSLTFTQYLVEDGTEIICLINKHQQNLESINQNQNLKIKDEPQALKSGQKIDLNENSPLSQEQNFIQLQKFQSKCPQINKKTAENQYSQTHNKLKKKQRINSDVAKKFQQQQQYKHQQIKQQSKEFEQKQSQDNSQSEKKQQLKENAELQAQQVPKLKVGSLLFIKQPNIFNQTKNYMNLAQKFSKFINRNVLDNWYQEPDSPVQLQYPKIQRKADPLIQEGDIIMTSNIVQKTSRFQFLSNISDKFNSAINKKQEKLALHKKKLSKIEQKPLNTLNRGQFIMVASLKNSKTLKSAQKSLIILKNRFDQYLQEKFPDQQSSIIEVQYPKIQKKTFLKAGDFILCGQMFQNLTKRYIVSELEERFQALIKQSQSKRQQMIKCSQDVVQLKIKNIEEHEQNKRWEQTQINQKNEQKNDQNQKFMTPVKNNPQNNNHAYLLNGPLKQKLISDIQEQVKLKLGDHLIIKRIDFTKPKSKLLEAIAQKYSHLSAI